MSAHLTAEIMEALAKEALSPGEAESARDHVARCSTCSAGLFEVVTRSTGAVPTQQVAGPPPIPATLADPATQLPRGSEIGRYVVLGRLATGGMGVVYTAYDPELDRRIAIKILQGQRTGSAGQSRLVREAQAMARLSHPNVIAVHDVGVWSERVFVAMELVEGPTLRTWMQAPSRTWREVVDALSAAGRGLAAAHAAGIVHRDFKPENILLGTDGRVRVLDFGLARAAGEDSSDGEPAAPAEQLSRALVSSSITQAGVVMGTMPYMAPEQLKGRGPDLRSDQFAFAITLHEALYGSRPFLSETPGDPQRWTVRDPPANTQVPPWVRRTVLRALAVDPAARFGSMDALLSALAADPTVKRRRNLVAAGATLALVAAVGGTWAIAQRNSQLCSGAGSQMANVWGAERAARIAQAFAATQKPFAAAAAAAVRKALDAYAAGWTARRVEACEATRVRHEQTEAVMTLKMACLDRALEELGSLASLFERADGPMVQRAAEATAGLSPLAACGDVASMLGRAKPRDAAAAAASERLSRALAVPAAHLHAGAFPDGLQKVAPLVEEARALGYAPLLAEALLLQGRLLLESGDLKGAEKTLLEAAAAAQEGRADDVAAAVWERLTKAIGVVGGRFAAGRDAARFAAATLSRVGSRDDLEALFLATRAGLAASDGNYAEALADATEAVRLQVQLYGDEHPATSAALHSMALAHLKRGELEQAETNFRRAMVLREKVLGPAHPETATSAHGLGAALQSAGKLDEARELYLKVVAIRERSLGDKHPELARTLNNLAVLHAVQGQFAQAQPYAERALDILQAVHGLENPFVAHAINNVGDLHKDQGRLDVALDYHLRALAIRERTLGAEHSDVAMSLNSIADCLRALGRYHEALDYNLRSVAIREKVLPKGHKDLANSLHGAAQTYLKLARPREAAAAAARAVEIRETARAPEVELASARFVLAQALGQDRRELPRAKALVQQARAVFDAKKDARKLAELDGWVAAQRW